MPAEVIIVTAIVVIFAVFAGTLAWTSWTAR